MLLYKVILARQDQNEILYQSISSKVKLPPLELNESHTGAMLIITTCDSSALNEDELKIYQGTHSGHPKAA